MHIHLLCDCSVVFVPWSRNFNCFDSVGVCFTACTLIVFFLCIIAQMRFRDSNDHWYVIAPIIVIATLTMLSMANIAIVHNMNQPWMSKACANKICIGIGAFVLVAVVCMYVPISYKLPRKYKIETSLPYVTEGTQNIVYAEQNRLWKVIQPLENMKTQKFQIEKRKTCSLKNIILRHLHISLMRASRSRIMQLQDSGDPISSFFPIIYSIHKRAMQVQKIDYSVENIYEYRDQIHDLNSHLKRLGLFLYDIQEGNLMVDEMGQLKVIDHDLVLTKAEHKLKLLGQKIKRRLKITIRDGIYSNIPLFESTNIFSNDNSYFW